MKINSIAIDKLIPYHNNPRKDQAVDKVASSINEYGFQQPIVVDKNMVVVVGHTRLMGAKKLGLKRVPTVIADLTETQAKAYRIADNRINEDSTWDMELLNLEIAGLSELNFDLDLLGYGFNQEITISKKNVLIDRNVFNNFISDINVLNKVQVSGVLANSTIGSRFSISFMVSSLSNMFVGFHILLYRISALG